MMNNIHNPFKAKHTPLLTGWMGVSLMLMIVGLFTSCSEDLGLEGMKEEQRALIGRAVNFNAAISDEFSSRTSYDHSGRFNDNDIMVIYRQYMKEDNSDFDAQNEKFFTYHFKTKYASQTSGIYLGREWLVADGSSTYLTRMKGVYTPAGDDRTLQVEKQTPKDSITWENGRTLRFRAWSRSNYSNTLASGSKGAYYPDFCISDWVNVSGPTQEIPLVLRHICSRVVFSVRNSGNKLVKAEICLNPEDYDGDQVKAADVQAAYTRMCMPAGVNIERGTLLTMTKAAYNATSDFSHIEEWGYSADGQKKLVEYGAVSASAIASDVQRPVFTGNVNSSLYFVTIPYDMSNNATLAGDILTLPAYTRFKIWLYDVNGGDNQSTTQESNYHVFSLDDIKVEDKTTGQMTAAYPRGLVMRPGYSYLFYVGYRYNQLTITTANSLSWTEQDLMGGDVTNETAEAPESNGYTWWTEAIRTAIPQGNEQYKPVFHIQTAQEFHELVRLVNGDAAAYGAANPIHRLVSEWEEKMEDGKVTKVAKAWDWAPESVTQKQVDADPTLFLTDDEKAKYVFYEHYYPANADKAAYSEPDYLRAAYPFYNTNLRRSFTVHLDEDIDLKDVEIDAIAKGEGTVFQGFFEGNNHVIRNLNVRGGYLFGNVTNAAIRNLRIESYHTVGLLNASTPTMDDDKETGWGCYIVGISIKANNTKAGHNAIAHSLRGRSYVVGCVHEGDATGALVGEASNMYMYGCMRTADNIGGGALLGAYMAGSKEFLKPAQGLKEYSRRPGWGMFMCNYYNKDIREASATATAIGNNTHTIDVSGIKRDDYSTWCYIRGCASRILCAQNDNFIDKKVSLKALSDQQRLEFYGMAPWKAMNYAIWKYNYDQTSAAAGTDIHLCKARYTAGTTGYDHLYPQLTSGAPENYGQWNPLLQNN